MLANINKYALSLFIIILIINGVFNAAFQLHYDESYYWVWGQNLSLSYYDHSPMIAYMMRLCSLFGHSEFFVRLPALLTSAATIIIMFQLAKRMFNQKVANIVIYLAIAWPMLEGAFFIATPDSPLNMFWALTLWAFYLGIFENKPYQIYLSGLWAGCTLLSKYTGILIFPGLFLFLLFSKSYRHYLRQKEVYIAFIIALIAASPIIIWNYQHQWVSFLFQINHGYDGERHFRFSSFGDFVSSQIGVGGPIMMLALFYYLLRYNKVHVLEDKLAFLFWPFAFMLIFFAHSSFYAYVGANWATPSLISGLIILAYWLAKFNNKWVYRSSLILIAIALLLVKLPTLFLPQALAKRISAIDVFYGNRELISKVKPLITKDTTLLACDYGNASRLWYYLNNKQRVYVLDKFRFANTYTYWNNQLQRPMKKAIFVCDTDDIINLDILRSYFTDISLVATPTFQNSIAHNKIYIYTATN